MSSTYRAISSTTLSSPASVISFSSIPSTYTDLVLVLDGNLGFSDTIVVQVNGDSASNYSQTLIRQDSGSGGGSVKSSRPTNQMYFTTNVLSAVNRITCTFEFMSYSNTNMFKQFLCSYAAPATTIQMSAGLWRSTSAISSIALSTSGYASGFTASLYGIKAE